MGTGNGTGGWGHKAGSPTAGSDPFVRRSFFPRADSVLRVFSDHPLLWELLVLRPCEGFSEKLRGYACVPITEVYSVPFFRCATWSLLPQKLALCAHEFQTAGDWGCKPLRRDAHLLSRGSSPLLRNTHKGRWTMGVGKGERLKIWYVWVGGRGPIGRPLCESFGLCCGLAGSC